MGSSNGGKCAIGQSDPDQRKGGGENLGHPEPKLPGPPLDPNGGGRLNEGAQNPGATWVVCAIVK